MFPHNFIRMKLTLGCCFGLGWFFGCSITCLSGTSFWFLWRHAVWCGYASKQVQEVEVMEREKNLNIYASLFNVNYDSTISVLLQSNFEILEWKLLSSIYWLTVICGLKSPVPRQLHLHFTCIYVQDVPEPQMRVWIVDLQQSSILFHHDAFEISNTQQWYDPNVWFAPR